MGETCWQRLVRLVMALASGYLLREEVAVDRSYDTWYDFVNGRLKAFGIGVFTRRVTEPRH